MPGVQCYIPWQNNLDNMNLTNINESTAETEMKRKINSNAQDFYFSTVIRLCGTVISTVIFNLYPIRRNFNRHKQKRTSLHYSIK